MSNAIQKYVNNRLCCLSSNIVKHDKEMKYSAENTKCLITNDFIANVFSNMLMCNPIASDITWYRAEYDIEWVEETPPAIAIPGTFTVNDITVVSGNGNRSVLIPFGGTYDITSLIDASNQLNAKLSLISSLDMFTTVEQNLDTGSAHVTFIFSEEWGNPYNFSFGSFSENIPLNASIINFTTPIIINPSNIESCFTKIQICDIKAWLDNYCKTCGSNASAQPII